MRRDRFKDAPWLLRTKVIVGGAGGIGSWLTLLLSRAGYQPVVYDFDEVEPHNIGGQLFSNQSIGEPKVEAIEQVVQDFSDGKITVFNEKYSKDSMSHTFVFAAFDNMEARKEMFEAWYKLNKDNPDAILIDGRLLMEQLQVFCVTPETAEQYQKEHLFDDADVEEAACTMKQTSHSAAMIASKMVAFFTNHITNVIDKQGKKIRQVPFLYEYFIPLNLTTVS